MMRGYKGRWNNMKAGETDREDAAQSPGNGGGIIKAAEDEEL